MRQKTPISRYMKKLIYSAILFVSFSTFAQGPAPASTAPSAVETAKPAEAAKPATAEPAKSATTDAAKSATTEPAKPATADAAKPAEPAGQPTTNAATPASSSAPANPAPSNTAPTNNPANTAPQKPTTSNSTNDLQVAIYAGGDAGPVRTGWGFFITKNFVVTTFQAAEKSPKLFISLTNNPNAEKIPVQAVVRYSALHDIAILQVPTQENAKLLLLTKDMPPVASRFGDIKVVKVDNNLFPKFYVTGTTYREGAAIVEKNIVVGILTEFDGKANQVIVTPGKYIRDVYGAPVAAMKPEDFYKAASTNKPDIRSTEMLKVCEKGVDTLKPQSCGEMADKAQKYKMTDTQLELLATGCLRGHNQNLCEKAIESHLSAFKWDQVEALAKEHCSTGSKPGCLLYMKELLNKKKHAELQSFAVPLCSGKNGDACAVLGKIEESKEEFNSAERYYLKACELKSGFGCGGASGIYFSQQKLDLERKYLTEGCNLGDGYSCFGLGVLAAEAKNQKEKVDYYKKGCDYKYGPSCFQVFTLKNRTGEKTKAQLAEEYLVGACAVQHVPSCEIVANFYLAKHDYRKALDASKPWCAEVNPKLCVAAYKASEALKDDVYRQFAFETAMKSFDLACSNNDKEACKSKAQLQNWQPKNSSERAPASKDSNLKDLESELEL